MKANNTPPAVKIEAAALVGAITAVGFHAFFTHNFGIFSILYLTGLLLGRFFVLCGQTRQTELLNQFRVRNRIFSIFAMVVALVLSIYFAVISAQGELYVRADESYRKGDVETADRLNSIALAIYPLGDRPYLLYAKIYHDILEKVPELDKKKRLLYFRQAMTYVSEAQEINPYRAEVYHLNARIIKSNPDLAGTKQTRSIEALYQKSINTNPRYFEAVRDLASYYADRGYNRKASKTVYNFIKHQLPTTKVTLDSYADLEPFIAKAEINEHLVLYKEKSQQLLEALERKGIAVEDSDI